MQPRELGKVLRMQHTQDTIKELRVQPKRQNMKKDKLQHEIISTETVIQKNF